MTHFIIKFRWWIIIACVVTGGLFAALIPLSETDPEIRNYIPETLSSRIETDRIEREFGTQDMVVILFSLDMMIIFLRMIHQSDAMSVGPRYIVRNERPEVAALPTLP